MTTFEHLTDENTPDNSSDTFEAIGRVIALWADIDDLLFDVFKIVLGTRDDVASVIYYRMNSLRDKIELTRKVAELTLSHQQCYDEIDETLKEIVKKSEFRNNIAHNPLISMVRFNAKIANFEHSLVSSTSKNKNTKRVVQAEIEHIEDHISEMIPLYTRLEKFPEFLATYLRVMKGEVGSEPS